MTPILITSGVIALSGILLVWFGIRQMLRKRLTSGLRNEFFGIVLFVIAAGLLLISSNLAIYQRLVFEAPVATISFRELGPLHFSAELSEVDAIAQTFDMRGDEWQLDARILKWHGVANLFGVDTRYRLHRLAGRYTRIDQERVATRSLYEIGQQPEVDMWKLANDYHRWLDWLVDAAYGSAVYLPMTDGAEYEVSVSQSGLVARPVNDAARRAVSRWIGL